MLFFFFFSELPHTKPIPGEGMCPRNEDWIPIGSYCYLIIKLSGNWNSFLSTCRKKHADANLASIHSAAENHILYTQIKEELPSVKYDFYIGLFRSQNSKISSCHLYIFAMYLYFNLFVCV